MQKDIKKLSPEIRDWIAQTDGVFTYGELDREVAIESEQAKHIRRQVIQQLVKEGMIEKWGKKDGVYRLIKTEAASIDWETADPANTVDVTWPFGLEKLVKIYRRNLAVIAGTFNAGKTAFCLDFIRLNMNRSQIQSLLPISYFSSEMGPEEMKLRVTKFGNIKWKFDAYERSSAFADVIRPDKINVIDYLEITNEFYLIAEELKAIFDHLKNGIALIAIQKKKGASFGRGAEFGLEKPRLYLSLENNRLKIEKGKNWAVEGQNPNGKMFSFSLVGGYKFINIKELSVE